MSSPGTAGTQRPSGGCAETCAFLQGRSGHAAPGAGARPRGGWSGLPEAWPRVPTPFPAPAGVRAVSAFSEGRSRGARRVVCPSGPRLLLINGARVRSPTHAVTWKVRR